GQDYIVAGVMAGLKNLPLPARLLDLYAGSGTLTLPLVAAGYQLHAVEGDPTATAALSAVLEQNPAIAAKLVVSRRDLVKQPLLAHEFSPYDAVILDPPRVGAEAQVTEIAKSETQRVIYVSCGPESFARDASILRDSGFAMTSLQPVDQFVWSPHVELVAAFARH
ncbi:MAG: RsmD family RNA methyltransferase, partial [Alphaproteobacteria bacterium]|nr:RsmD family RNA methyltransferase [Alphaproteobacteria bacterium]